MTLPSAAWSQWGFRIGQGGRWVARIAEPNQTRSDKIIQTRAKGRQARSQVKVKVVKERRGRESDERAGQVTAQLDVALALCSSHCSALLGCFAGFAGLAGAAWGCLAADWEGGRARGWERSGSEWDRDWGLIGRRSRGSRLCAVHHIIHDAAGVRYMPHAGDSARQRRYRCWPGCTAASAPYLKKLPVYGC